MSTSKANYTLTKPSDQELSDLVAIRLCGWERNNAGKWVREGMSWGFAPNFASSASSAVPLIEAAGVKALCSFDDGLWTVSVSDNSFTSDSLPRSICVVLLRSSGVSIYGL